jgi:hypothetical protein
MEEGQAVIEGLGSDIGDFDNASHWHLVDQQFENDGSLVICADRNSL